MPKPKTVKPTPKSQVNLRELGFNRATPANIEAQLEIERYIENILISSLGNPDMPQDQRRSFINTLAITRVRSLALSSVLNPELRAPYNPQPDNEGAAESETPTSETSSDVQIDAAIPE